MFRLTMRTVFTHIEDYCTLVHNEINTRTIDKWFVLRIRCGDSARVHPSNPNT